MQASKGEKEDKSDNVSGTEQGSFRSDSQNQGHSKYDRFIKSCLYCGRLHPINRCTAYGKICNNFNHFSIVCRNKNKIVNKITSETNDLNNLCIDQENNVTSNANNILETVSVDCNVNVTNDSVILDIDVVNLTDKKSWSVNLLINNISNFKVDTGAEANIIHVEKVELHNLDRTVIKPCVEKLLDYNKQDIVVL